MKEYKVITALFLSAVMLGTAPLTVWGAESFSTGESFSDGTENIPDIVTDSALSGESSERDYELSVETGTEVELTESDFYDPEFRVEKYVKVRNSGKKETRAKNYLNNLNTRIKEEQDKLINQQAELTAKRQLIEQKDLDTVKTTINGLKTVKNKTELINFLTQKEVELQDGRKLSKFQYELGQTIADPVKRVMLAQLLQSDFDFSKIEKQAETKVIKQFKENLLKKTPSRQQTRNEMSWEDFKS